MMNAFKAIAVLVLLSIGSHLYSQNKSRVSFDNNWKFKLDSTTTYQATNVNDAKWRTLNLPHDWSIEGEFSEKNPATYGGGALPGGIGWYRKTFTIPATDKDKAISITFDGVYKNSEVWINGHSLGVRPNGYMSFEYELSQYLKFGAENVIAVKVDNSRQPNSRWYSGSGIFRNVWLTTTDKLYIINNGTYITTPVISSTSATVAIETKVSNKYEAFKNYELSNIIYDAKGKVVSKTNSTFNQIPKSVVGVSQQLKVEKPTLWSVENPYLYKVVSLVSLNGKVISTYETSLGIRYFKFDSETGFSLNGKPTKIVGVCNHHDLGALGAAVNTRAIERQLEILKRMGCNGIRTSHNPPAPELLDLADKMGFIVMDEAFDMWAKPKNPFDYHLDWDQWHKQDLIEQLVRDRNHPSIFVWSIGNEIPEQWGDAKKGDATGRALARELVSIVKMIDTTREIVTANNETGLGNNIIQSGAFDLIGYNYHHDEWEKFHDRWPVKKLIITESTSALEMRGQYDLVSIDTIRRWPARWDLPFKNPNGGYTVSAYDHVSAPWGSTHEESIKALLKSPVVSGMYVWTGFDYLGEPTPYAWPARSSYFGIIDLAGFPKDVYYLYQSLFTTKPVLHIYPHWNWNKGDTVDIVSYYNNADEVELFLNGTSLGTRCKKGDQLHVKWRVPYAPGTLKAVSRIGGQVVLTKEVNTAVLPAKIILTADRTTIKADGKDLSFVTATIVDNNGVMVPDANNSIHYTIKGAGFIAGLDNGDPTNHESFKGNQHKAFNGLALAIIQSNALKGTITLTAEAQGLQGATIIITGK